MMFTKAIKYQAKGRVALIGPPGAGKSYTQLVLATTLAKGGKIACVDTEHGSLSKYADLFDFDVVELSSFTHQQFQGAMKEAADAGYAVFCCDSLSHFWVGKGGALEFVDERKARARDQMSGWKDFRPHERAMVDAMIASPCHVITTMRTKTEYAEQVDDNGKKKRIKIGLAPVQREGLEYEFDLVGYMDDDNNLIVDKTRCPHYSGRTLAKPKAADFAPFAAWLEGTARPVQAPLSSAEAMREIRGLLTHLDRKEEQAVHWAVPGKKRLTELTAVELDAMVQSLRKIMNERMNGPALAAG